MEAIEIGRILRANNTLVIAGCRVNQLNTPALGSLVKVIQPGNIQTFGIIYDISITDDGLVRQLVVLDEIEEAVLQDNRQNRIVPIEISIICVGYSENEHLYHLLPPRPAMVLDQIVLCDQHDIVKFTSAANLSYVHHLLRLRDIPVGDIIAAHLHQVKNAHELAGQRSWFDNFMNEIISLLRDDYETLMPILSAIAQLA